jgi:F-type H+-transporting ATPase subunit a
LQTVTTTVKKGGAGFKRWIILGLVVLGIVCQWVIGGPFKVVSPAVVIPGEPIWLSLPTFPVPGGEFTFTNTMLATILTDLVLFAFALGALRFAQSGKAIPGGLYNAFETIVEFLWDATRDAGGKWAKSLFPFVATIFMLVFAANMVKLIPGFESIGYMKQAHGNITGYKPVELIPGVIWGIDGSQIVAHSDESHSTEDDHGTTTDSHDTTDSSHTPKLGRTSEAEAGYCVDSCEVVPFLRGSATDLNFTFALAIMAVVMTQVFGLRALGPSYLTKFFNFTGLITKPGMGLIDFGVGFLELISEFSKILSFSFRLFGNIFAGALLLSILGSLTVVVLPVGLYLFEMFFGTIQAYVFAMLALVFMSQATVSHHGDDHGHAEHAETHH